MLIGRKDKDRCAKYWPRHQDSSPLHVCGLHIHNAGVSTSRDPIFRVTYIRITDDFGEEVGVFCFKELEVFFHEKI
ncbi:hypothetical protein OESDEN_16726 [Oesophagostomum dentatum]|uniref:Tyrosine-protein phosphatase domain-containing protein n=1 Tax=Oesophagostomum dentatum TaxID=61180 RepID=A0A0B1SE34_OESDE|nr:hypothetical protein OESDEN_16726 [Oesophagostomum dentatum]